MELSYRNILLLEIVMKKKSLVLVLIIGIMAISLASCGGKSNTDTSSTSAANSSEEGQTKEDESEEADVEENAGGIGMRNVELVVKDYGTIKLELDGDTAPITVENFVNLAESGFYNGLTFHRIMDGFMIQGGDPQGTGFGGSDQTIKGEFAANGVKNDISHKKGVISMARSQHPDSASSQFFITVADSEFLDGNYAAFGRVVEGQDIADKIAADAQPIDNNGTIPKENQPIIEEIKVVD